MLVELFKSEERLRILYYSLYQRDFTVTQVSRETGVTKGLVSRYLNKLTEFGLLVKHGRVYRFGDSAMIRVIKLLLNLNKIDEDSLKRDWIKGFGLFGSWAKGTNTDESDLDVWIKTETYPSEFELGKLQKKLREMVGTEVNLVVLTHQKIKELKEKDRPFYNSIVNDSIVLWGESIEL
ncbi:MAG: hypothetical protein PWR26_1254 [Methanosarcinales archaeon]|uniref:nucleotidyltransferase domain-containing protein n=1 Tax=Methermicoccus shengliensis TaxID=660064 RepID=UPI000A038946|nr:nucleotidyltransferase domain-containing protein [Methermicoccus shengliensis]MDI3488537.1 hypothetical protein [Methanosarcinales archaeon]